jgi:hypothetical protein
MRTDEEWARLKAEAEARSREAEAARLWAPLTEEF